MELNLMVSVDGYFMLDTDKDEFYIVLLDENGTRTEIKFPIPIFKKILRELIDEFW